ncbi:MAG TPA: L-2-hydroxyglutarate oxidase [Terriglobales bacterium]|nr:L-2-hydroxyglutarate oxidase [Terriglobales bacterium]
MHDVLIIGGGIVGLATALEVTRRQPAQPVLVLEKEPRLAAHQSGRNSGVIHSGIYYRPGSLKARLCVEGAAAMVAFCREHGIPHRVCGKLVVATDSQEAAALGALFRRGNENGVPGLELVGPERIRALEPHCAGVAALYVPGAAITDYAAVTEKYAELVRASGSEVRTGARVHAIRRHSGRTIVETTAGEFTAHRLINCAGLHSDRVARLAGADPGVIIVPFRGEYYQLVPEKRALVRGLIYPMPDPKYPFLGVHLTSHLDGRVTAGPNAVLALKREGYRKTDIDPADTLSLLSSAAFWLMCARYWPGGLDQMYRSWSKRAFTRKLQRLLPEVQESDLVPDKTGVRAQAVDRDGKLVDDFRIVRDQTIIHVLNVPSPAATASLAIGKVIAQMLDEMA